MMQLLLRRLNLLTPQTPIKDFYGVIIGYIDEDSQGNKVATDFYRRKVGTYDKRSDVTRDFYGRIVSKGDTTSSLIFTENEKNKRR